ncbi:MAG: hypothetical protein Tsb005_20020 [Gammaproteobacteria bacterium]
MIKRVALLATGDEIINGDILNSNTRDIAQQLIQHHIQPGIHMTVSDTQTEIEHAIHYLLTQHEALITFGGLGPTSDDRTRFALSQALNQPLCFHEPSWQHNIKRMQEYAQRRGIVLTEIPECAKQQALFPEHATVLTNHNGTANACYFWADEKFICMLPGPPNECMPIFIEHVLPCLMTASYNNQLIRKSWWLTGASESAIAELLDPIARQFPTCSIGYRFHRPDLEVKLVSADEQALENLTIQVLAIIKSYLKVPSAS